MPNHVCTIEVSQEDMDRGAREESYAKLLMRWRAGEIDDSQWQNMRQLDPEFRSWLHKMGAQ